MATVARKFSIISMVGALALAISSCTSQDTAETPTETPSAGSTVTLVTYDSYAISDETLESFTDETGVKVEVVRAGDGAQVVNRAILTKDTPEGDVLFGADNNLLSRALSNDLFESYQPEAVQDLPTELTEGTDGAATPIDTGDVCINYDTAALKKQGVTPPETLDDLTKPEYRGLLVVENPATSTPGLAFLLTTIAEFGTDGFQDYWKRLRDNDVLVENSWDSAYYQQFSGGSGEGDRPMVVSYASSPAAEVIFAEKPPKEAPTAAMLSSCYQQIEYAGLLNGAKNPAGGRALLDFMLSDTYQNDLPLNNFVYPVVASAKVPKEFDEFAPKPTDPAELPANEVDANRETWIEQWTSVVQP